MLEGKAFIVDIRESKARQLEEFTAEGQSRTLNTASGLSRPESDRGLQRSEGKREGLRE